MTQILIDNFPVESGIFLYGALSGEPLKIEKTGHILVGKKIEGFMLGKWWHSTTEEIRTRVREKFSWYLKEDFATKTYKELTFNELEEAL